MINLLKFGSVVINPNRLFAIEIDDCDGESVTRFYFDTQSPFVTVDKQTKKDVIAYFASSDEDISSEEIIQANSSVGK